MWGLEQFPLIIILGLHLSLTCKMTTPSDISMFVLETRATDLVKVNMNLLEARRRSLKRRSLKPV